MWYIQRVIFDSQRTVTSFKMPTYKLTYFPARGKAESARYLFALADVKYEDERVTLEEWKELKPKFGLGHLPVLEVDGKQITQSGAIFRYIGRNHGLYPSDPFESAQVDVVMETMKEFDPDIQQFFRTDDAEKEKAIKKYMEETAPKRFGDLEKLLVNNKDGKGWFVGDKISVADAVTFNILHDWLPSVMGSGVGGLDLTAYPALEAFISRFRAEEKISEWLKNRPVTML